MQMPRAVVTEELWEANYRKNPVSCQGKTVRRRGGPLAVYGERKLDGVGTQWLCLATTDRYTPLKAPTDEHEKPMAASVTANALEKLPPPSFALIVATFGSQAMVALG